MPRTKSNRTSTSSSSTKSASRSRSTRGGSTRGGSTRSGSKRSRKSSGSSWLGLSLGLVGLCGLVYGLMQLTSVSEFMEPMISDVGEFFGLTSDEGIDSMNITHDRTYSTVS